ncbi:hypothetical protein CRUP_013791, partial [Coryphaenoides rupestris]
MLKMMGALESLMSANSEKEQRIEQLLETLSQYRKVQDLMKEKLSEADYDDIPDNPSVSVAMETRPQVVPATDAGTGRSSGESIPCIAVFSEMTALDRERLQTAERSSECAPQSSGAGQTSNVSVAEQSVSKEGSSPPPLQNDSFGTKKMRSSFGRGFFFKPRGGKRTTSAPNLAEAEQSGTEHLDLAGAQPPQRKSASDAPTATTAILPETKKKSKGLRKFFGRIKRSHSTSLNLDDASDVEFRRGGVRATAGPRLGWSRDLKHAGGTAEAPFSQWSNEQVCGWLQAQGLGMYVAQGQEWIRSGQTLLQATQHEELCIRNPLHKKKLQLALQALGGPEEDDLQGKLNHNWVT